MALNAGTILENRYRLGRMLGQGGFGAVYLAWDMNLRKPVAIKENLDTLPEAQRQFQREAQILSNLSHPNLPRVTDYFVVAGMGEYLVMDFVEGENLQEILDRSGGPLSANNVLVWIDQVCDALIYLHTRKPPIIHRDIKPANIKVTPHGQAVLVDFGVSKAYDPTLKTTVGARAVTPGYSPPEQYGTGSTDARSDVYALGATLYTLLTGQEPPESVARVASGIPLVSPRRIVPSIPSSIEAAISHACATSKTDRFQSVTELKQALLLRTSAAPVPAHKSLPAKSKRTGVPAWGLVLGGLLVAFLVVAGLVGAWAVMDQKARAATMAVASVQPLTVVPSQVPGSSGTLIAMQAFSSTRTSVPMDQEPAHTPTPVPTSTPRPQHTPTPLSTSTPVPAPSPTPTASCPAVSGPFAAVWNAVKDRTGCATSAAIEGLVAEENFDGGKMFWREPLDYAQVMMLLNNGTWQIVKHAPFVEGSPDFKCPDANTPERCPPTPKRGFGMVWCDVPHVRSSLGNATDCERGYRGTMQTFDRGSVLRSDDGTIYVFYAGGGWERK